MELVTKSKRTGMDCTLDVYFEQTEGLPKYLNDKTCYKMVLITSGSFIVEDNGKYNVITAPAFILINEKAEVKVVSEDNVKSRTVYFRPSIIREEFTIEALNSGKYDKFCCAMKDENGDPVRAGEISTFEERDNLITKDFKFEDAFSKEMVYQDALLLLEFFWHKQDAVYYALTKQEYDTALRLSMSVKYEINAQPDNFWILRTRYFIQSMLFVTTADFYRNYRQNEIYKDKLVADVTRYFWDHIGEEIIMERLLGKTAVVTGANSGMGFATARALINEGATVIMLCRDETRGKEAYKKLQRNDSSRACLILCDLGDYDSIRRFASQVKERFGRVDILVNNAGFISLDRQFTKEGVERQFGINHVGHFLLTKELLPIMPRGARIVNVASGAHKVGRIHFRDINLSVGFNVITAYSQSKLANVLFTRELARRLAGRGITANCCHPGAVATNIGIDRKTGFGKTITGLLKPFFLTPEEGADTAIFLATDDTVSDISGEYFYKRKIARSSRRSKDMKLAKILWRFTDKLITQGAPEDTSKYIK